MKEELHGLTCPLCFITGFSATGLRHHRCRSTPDRRRLTPEEYVAVINKARAKEATAGGVR